MSTEHSRTAGSPMTPSVSKDEDWVLSVICWKVENLSARLPQRREPKDDDVYAVCKFKLSGDMSSCESKWHDQIWEEQTDVHHRARLDGSGIFHYRWKFNVPPAFSARFAFPELKIQLRSEKKHQQFREKLQKEYDEKKAEGKGAEKLLPNPADKIPMLDHASSLAEGTLALHDLFTAADTNFKLKKEKTTLGEERPLRLQMRPVGSDGVPPPDGESDKTIMLLTLELASGSKAEDIEDGRVLDGMSTGNKDAAEREAFNRAACGKPMSDCTPL